MKKKEYNIAVIGAGIVGASAACLLAQQDLRVALIESKMPDIDWPIDQYDLRVSAINRASQQLFEKLGVWQVIQSLRISPYRHMTVWDSSGNGTIEFDCKEIPGPYLGYIIENCVVLKALHEKIAASKNIDLLCPEHPQAITKKDNHIVIALNDKSIQAKLLIGADGAHSWVREQCNITLKTRPYHHIALVTTVKTEKPHANTAWQCFLPDGPVALLPLENKHYCSVVWSTVLSYAEQLLTMEENKFNQVISDVFIDKLGKIEKVDKIVQFPLYERHVEQYVQDSLALVGDAAHTIHPLAGQGVNLGLADAACLNQVIAKARADGKNYSKQYILRRYERERKSENWNMIMAMQGLKKLFGSQNTLVQWLRKAGLKAANDTTLIKRWLINMAS